MQLIFGCLYYPFWIFVLSILGVFTYCENKSHFQMNASTLGKLLCCYVTILLDQILNQIAPHYMVKPSCK
jgi:hypothetical protein